jgi:hypothetical protein
MSRRRYSSEEIISELQEAEVLLSRGQTVGQGSRLLGIRERTYYRWRKEHGRVRTDQALGARVAKPRWSPDWLSRGANSRTRPSFP